MAEFMLQKIMGEISIATTLTFDLELRGKSIVNFLRDRSYRTRSTTQPDGDQYSFLPPRDVSGKASRRPLIELCGIELFRRPVLATSIGSETS